MKITQEGINQWLIRLTDLEAVRLTDLLNAVGDGGVGPSGTEAIMVKDICKAFEPLIKKAIEREHKRRSDGL